MRRRDKAVGKVIKTQRHKALKRRNAPKTVRPHGLPVANLQEQLDRRTSELHEALAQQAASTEVLQVISSSSGELQPVFDAMLKNATRICEATFACLGLFEGEALRFAAISGASAESEFFHPERLHQPDGCPYVIPLARAKRTAQTPDLRAERGYLERDPFYVTTADVGGARTALRVPLLKDGILLGHLWAFRQEVRPFTDKQIELVKNFAAQAVIAIENTRLLNELRQRTDDLSEALEQQTATSEVLKVISTSPGELEPVFNAMLENATRICEAAFGSMLLMEGDAFRRVAVHNAPPKFAEFHRKVPVVKPQQIHDLQLLIETKRPVHIADAAAVNTDSPIVKYAGARTLLVVPLLKDDALIGAIGIYRQEVRPFTDKQIELVANFAAQAVIAIENTRLLGELRQRTDDLSEALEQQTATSEVLQVISSSPGELEPVFNAMLANAVRICAAKFGMMHLYEAGGFRLAAVHNTPPALTEYQRNLRIWGPDTGLGELARTKQTVHVKDTHEGRAYAERDEGRMAAIELGGVRTFVAIPMLKEGELIGAIGIYRHEVRPFTDKQVELVENFAAQAVIAIENARLLSELRQRTTDLSKSLEDLRTTQDRLVQTQKLASLGQLTAGIAHEIKNPLNFVNNFSGVSAELIDELQEALTDVSLNDKRRSEITELMETLRRNLEKVVQHGKRADAIVKNMLLHSREGSGEHRLVDINAVVEESLNLAYHGARAEKQGFNITLERSLDPTAGEVDVFPQDITRVLLNLISNGFYAATKRKAEVNGGDYEPTLAATTKSLGDRVEIRIRDNGTGIPPEVKERLFTPFFTTKPAGEGTGLGLSISHDIIVKQHGGSIEVDTQPGEFTEFRIILPRTAATIAKLGERA